MSLSLWWPLTLLLTLLRLLHHHLLRLCLHFPAGDVRVVLLFPSNVLIWVCWPTPLWRIVRALLWSWAPLTVVWLWTPPPSLWPYWTMTVSCIHNNTYIHIYKYCSIIYTSYLYRNTGITSVPPLNRLCSRDINVIVYMHACTNHICLFVNCVIMVSTCNAMLIVYNGKCMWCSCIVSVANVSLEMSAYSVNEGDRFLMVCVSLEGELERNIIVNISTDDVSAFGIIIKYSVYECTWLYTCT